MPELPEVEVLVRHLAPLLKDKTIQAVEVRRVRVVRPTSVQRFIKALEGRSFGSVTRRGKYLVFHLGADASDPKSEPLTLLGHLGMTGRMYLTPPGQALPKHAAVVLNLGKHNFVFEDTRYFGRLTFDPRALQELGPEPLSEEFTEAGLARHSSDRASQSKSSCSINRWWRELGTSMPTKRFFGPKFLRDGGREV